MKVMSESNTDSNSINHIGLISFVLLILFGIIVYFGRIYFPENFHPESVSFFDNYWVLVLGTLFIVSILALFLGMLFYSISELIRVIREK